METRAKDLKDFTMWKLTNSGVKFLDLGNAVFSKFRFFGSDFAATPSQIHGKGFSKHNDEFTVSFLYNQIGKDLSADVEKSMPCNSPFIAVPLKKMISSLFLRRRTGSFKGFLKPMKEPNVGVGDLQNSPIVAIFIAIARFIFKFACMKTALSVYYSSKISKMKRIVDFGFIKNAMFMVDVIELHRPPVVTSSLASIHMEAV